MSCFITQSANSQLLHIFTQDVILALLGMPSRPISRRYEVALKAVTIGDVTPRPPLRRLASYQVS